MLNDTTCAGPRKREPPFVRAKVPNCWEVYHTHRFCQEKYHFINGDNKNMLKNNDILILHYKYAIA